MNSYDVLAVDISNCPVLYGDYNVTSGKESVTDQYSISVLRESAIASLSLDTWALLRDWAPRTLTVWLRPAAVHSPNESGFFRPEFIWQIYAAPGAHINLNSPRGCQPEIQALEGSLQGLANGSHPDLNLVAGPSGAVFRLSWIPWELTREEQQPDLWAGEDWHLEASRTVACRIISGITAQESK